MHVCHICGAVGRYGVLGCPKCQQRFLKSEGLTREEMLKLVLFADQHLPWSIALVLGAIYRGDNNAAVKYLVELPT